MRVCWNWQTGMFEGHVCICTYGFKSHYSHHFVAYEIPHAIIVALWFYLYESGFVMYLIYTVSNLSNYTNVRQVLKNEFNMSNRLITKLKQSKSIFLNDIETYKKRGIGIYRKNKQVVGFNKKENKNQTSYRSYVYTDWGLPKFNEEFFKEIGVIK